ncbi:MAG: glycerol-3-phosphate 1-O-acyltransferase PlsY [Ruminococcaceae bacterium]|nr:glycerol-3-phosphate 1-O-acyltransferase PlsY [Oscillospiraceae bacterium]
MPYTFSEIWKYGFFGLLSNNTVGATMLVGAILCALLSYLIGSFNFAILLSKYKYKQDIRDFGSSNAGATNVMRTYGKKAALVTFAGDGAKTLIAILLIGRMSLGLFGAYISGLFCIIGHAYPVYFKFKGGKGVTVTAFTILSTSPISFLVLIIIFALMLACFKMVSLASITGALIYPLVLSAVYGKDLCVVIAVIMAALVIYLHRDNIVRISQGTERKISFKTNKKK